MSRRWSVGILITLVFGGSLACAGRWRRVDDFVSGLECGMSENAIEDYTEQFGKARFSSTDKDNRFVVQKRDTLVRLWLSDDGLGLYQITWTAPLTRAFSEPKRNVCSSEQLVEVSLIGPATLAGGTITLDGQKPSPDESCTIVRREPLDRADSSRTLSDAHRYRPAEGRFQYANQGPIWAKVWTPLAFDSAIRRAMRQHATDKGFSFPDEEKEE